MASAGKIFFALWDCAPVDTSSTPVHKIAARDPNTPFLLIALLRLNQTISNSGTDAYAPSVFGQLIRNNVSLISAYRCKVLIYQGKPAYTAMPSTEKRQAAFELDLGRYELTRDGRRIKLEKKPMELLIYMLSRKEQLVSRSEIIARLWRSELFIDADPNINNIVRKIRTALTDNSARPRFVETVIGKGYRFIGPVKITGATFVETNPGHLAVHGVQREAAGVESVRPTLAVLPLCLLGRAVDDRGICLGLADGLVTRLGNLPGIDVLPL